MAANDERIVPVRKEQPKPIPLRQPKPVPVQANRASRPGTKPIFHIDPAPLPTNRPVVSDRGEDTDQLMGYID